MTEVFDEELFADAWRINDAGCKIPSRDKQGIVFLHPAQSVQLWKTHISGECAYLMEMPVRGADIMGKARLDFACEKEGVDFFARELQRFASIVFFWGLQSACWVQKKTFVPHWSAFFYPSDESSIIFIPNSHKKIFSHGEDFFVSRFTAGQMHKGRVSG